MIFETLHGETLIQCCVSVLPAVVWERVHGRDLNVIPQAPHSGHLTVARLWKATGAWNKMSCTLLYVTAKTRLFTMIIQQFHCFINFWNQYNLWFIFYNLKLQVSYHKSPFPLKIEAREVQKSWKHNTFIWTSEYQFCHLKERVNRQSEWITFLLGAGSHEQSHDEWFVGGDLHPLHLPTTHAAPLHTLSHHV